MTYSLSVSTPWAWSLLDVLDRVLSGLQWSMAAPLDTYQNVMLGMLYCVMCTVFSMLSDILSCNSNQGWDILDWKQEKWAGVTIWMTFIRVRASPKPVTGTRAPKVHRCKWGAKASLILLNWPKHCCRPSTFLDFLSKFPRSESNQAYVGCAVQPTEVYAGLSSQLTELKGSAFGARHHSIASEVLWFHCLDGSELFCQRGRTYTDLAGGFTIVTDWCMWLIALHLLPLSVIPFL